MAPAHSRRNSGFTQIELIIVIVVIGILAVVIMPRFANRQTFETRGFADEALAAVQFARKHAVAARRNVCVLASGNTLTLTMASLAGDARACTNPAPNPAGSNTLTPPHNDVNFSGTLNIIFDGQGRPLNGSNNSLLSADATVIVAGDTNYTLGVAAGTGYAYVTP